MSDTLFLDAESFGVLAEVVGTYIAYGLGLGFIFWVLGRVVGFVIRFARY